MTNVTNPADKLRPKSVKTQTSTEPTLQTKQRQKTKRNRSRAHNAAQKSTKNERRRPDEKLQKPHPKNVTVFDHVTSHDQF